MSGHVYLIEGGGFFKIGRADNVYQHLEALRAQSTTSLHLLCAVAVETPEPLEAELHHMYEAQRIPHVPGGWFTLTARDAAAAADHLLQFYLEERSQAHYTGLLAHIEPSCSWILQRFDRILQGLDAMEAAESGSKTEHEVTHPALLLTGSETPKELEALYVAQWKEQVRLVDQMLHMHARVVSLSFPTLTPSVSKGDLGQALHRQNPPLPSRDSHQVSK